MYAAATQLMSMGFILILSVLETTQDGQLLLWRMLLIFLKSKINAGKLYFCELFLFYTHKCYINSLYYYEVNQKRQFSVNFITV